MEILGIIPARAGSKGIRKKNIAKVAGRPLVTYTCDAANESKGLTRTIISTDDHEISATAGMFGIDAPFTRSPETCKDDSPMLDVLVEALTKLKEDEGYEPDAVVLLQPTSPLREGSDIDKAIKIFQEADCDSVVSVVQVPHNFNPVSLMRIEGGKLEPYEDSEKIYRRQDKPLFYARNGPAVLVVKSEVILGGSLYGDDCRPSIMGQIASLDVDTSDDLALAGFFLRRRKDTDPLAKLGL